MATVAEQPTDSELLAAVATRRDPDALALLYDRYGGIAYGLAQRIVADTGAAEDVVQEAFFNVWRNAARYAEDRGSVRTWVLSIVHNQAIDKLRRSRSKRLEAQIEAAGEVADRQDVFQEVAANLERHRIRQALQTLPNEQRTTIELAYFGGCSHSEIAGLLRIPLGTVKGRLRLGLDKLRVALAEPALELRPE